MFGIEEQKARFYLLYAWFGRRRWFNLGLAGWSVFKQDYLSYTAIRKQAFADGHKTCGYKQFIERQL